MKESGGSLVTSQPVCSLVHLASVGEWAIDHRLLCNTELEYWSNFFNFWKLVWWTHDEIMMTFRLRLLCMQRWYSVTRKTIKLREQHIKEDIKNNIIIFKCAVKLSSLIFSFHSGDAAKLIVSLLAELVFINYCFDMEIIEHMFGLETVPTETNLHECPQSMQKPKTWVKRFKF